jgi:hypothetical protein
MKGKNILMDDEKLEEQMNNYDLEDEEKELVRKGLYDVTSFGEEELEDDDYYNEDVSVE